MTKYNIFNRDTSRVGAKLESSSAISSPFTIKFGVFMAFLVSFLLPIILFSPLLLAAMLGIPLVEQIGFSADNFGIFVFFVQTVGLLITITLIARKLKQRRASWSSVGLKRFKVFQAIRYVLGYYLILLGLFIGLAIIATILGVEAPPAPEDESGGTDVFKLMNNFWLTFMLSVVLAPIIEEVVFRGVLFPAIKKRYGLFAGIIFSSLIFTLVHINPVQMLSVLPLGMYLAVMYNRTSSIYPGIVLHATWNLLVLLIAQ